MSRFAFYDFEFGILKIGYADSVVTSLKRMERIDWVNGSSDFCEPCELSDTVFSQLQEYFAGKRRVFDFPYAPQGTVFQKRVWAALCDIPFGETRTYKQVAQAIGNPKACRAVGGANNKNPIGIVVPCHRVIGVNGALVGYAGGLEMKKALLDLEKRVLFL